LDVGIRLPESTAVAQPRGIRHLTVVCLKDKKGFGGYIDHIDETL
jgi:hypothetical protein